ncbi:T9SS type A sorting domain-containing protein [Chitinophaga sp. 212800010-3]|uniref:T9SS type A sorting domain-containing protein n=1 Tax=unclassified Chitinophaga TaxID=2619133 RepID=UPI002DE9DF26|nr:Por-Secre-tail domain-containing protein [Chitinophaga sp. 212800010-3]
MKNRLSRRLLLVLLLTGSMQALKAQLVLNRQVVAAGGGSGTVLSQIQMSYTIGEPVIMSIANGQLLLTQGFQQPEEFPKLPPGVSPVKSYILYPNPAVTTTKIVFDLLTNVSVTLEVVNTAGQTIYHQFLQLSAGKSTTILPVDHFASGIYTVVLNINGNVYFEKLIVQ